MNYWSVNLVECLLRTNMTQAQVTEKIRGSMAQFLERNSGEVLRWTSGASGQFPEYGA